MATLQEIKGYPEQIEKSWVQDSVKLVENQSKLSFQSNQFIRRGRSQFVSLDTRRKSTYLQKTIQIDKIEYLKRCINKIRQVTQVQFIISLNINQVKSNPLMSSLSAINDLASDYVTQMNQKNENEHNFSISYLNQPNKQEKITKFQQLITKILQSKNIFNQSEKNRFLLILKYSFRPSNPFIILWNCIKMLLIIHIFFSFPLEDAFGEEFQETLLPTLSFAELIFLVILDILLRFNMGIYYRGDFVEDKIKIAQIYLYNGFIVDFIALIAFSLHYFIQDNFFITLLKYLFFLKFKQLHKFLKFLRQEIDPRNRYSSQISLAQLLLQVIMMAHIIATCWIGVGKYSSQSSQITWMSGLDQRWSSLYIKAVYYACMTMTTVGYGDILPQNDFEYAACIAIMLLSCGIFAYTLNTITQIFQDMNKDRKHYQQDLEMMNSYMIRKNIDNNTRRKVKNYLKSLWMLQGETPNLTNLSQSLQKELLVQDKGKLVFNLSFLSNSFSNKFLNELLNIIEEKNYQPQEVINFQNGLQLLYLGDIQICWGQSFVERLNKRGDVFGIESLFENQDKQIKLKCNDFSTIYSIPAEKFMKIIQGFPLDHEFYCMVRDLVQVNQNYFALQIRCPLCLKNGHFMTKCPETFYVPCKSLKIHKHNFSQKQTRTYRSRNTNHSHYKTLKNQYLVEEVALANETNFKQSSEDPLSSDPQCSLSLVDEEESDKSMESWKVIDSGREKNELPNKNHSANSLKSKTHKTIAKSQVIDKKQICSIRKQSNKK